MNHKYQLNTSWVILGFIGSAVLGIAISYGDIYFFHVMMAAMLGFGIIKIKGKKFQLSLASIRNNHSLFLLILFVWYGFSLIWAPDVIAGLKYLFYIGCGIIITFTIIKYGNSQSRIQSMFKVLSLLFIIEIGIALLESFTSFRLPISPYSSYHTFFGKESVDFFAFDSPFAYADFQPPTGFHWNTNNLAITMVMILPFFLCSQRLWIKLLGGSAITLITVLAASRAVFLGLILVICIYFIFIKKQMGTLVLIWATIIGLFWSMQVLSESEDPRINEVANSIEAMVLYLSGDIDVGGSLEWRRELVDNGITALAKTKGLGVGAGGSTVLQERLGGVAGRFTSMHNFWVEILVEGGIIIGLLFLIWFSDIIIKLWQKTKDRQNKFLQYMSQSLLLSLMGFIPAAIAASSTIYFFPMWILFGLSISVINLGENKPIELS